MLAVLTILMVLVAAQTAGQADSNAPEQSRGEALVRALRRSRPPNTPIAPGSAAEPGRRKNRQLLPEGWAVIQQAGVLEQSDQGWRFVTEPPAERPPFHLLENAQLEMITRMSAGSPTPFRFVVSGEVTVFNGQNGLLIRTASVDRTASFAEGQAPDAAAKPRADASAERVLDRMRGEQPERPLLTPTTQASTSRGDRPTGISRNLLLDGTPLIRRTGRLVRRDQNWVLMFDSDRTEGADPPLQLLPNQTLEAMVRESGESGGGVFVVSGEVTLFERTNYLLARSVARRVDLGNLRR